MTRHPITSYERELLGLRIYSRDELEKETKRIHSRDELEEETKRSLIFFILFCVRT